VQYTSNYNLKKPEGTDIVNIDDLNDNADILDQKLKEVENKADSAPPNSVNDAAIGSRTPNQSQAPASPGTGTLTQLISWLANRIKAVTGKTNWWDTPPTTLQAAKTHMDAAAPHSGHETPSGAQAKADGAEARAKAYTDQEVGEVAQALNSHKAAAAPHSGHETPSGAQTKANAAEANAKGYTDTHAGTKNTHGVGSGYYIAKTSRSDQLPAWNDMQGKPSNFPPSAHKSTHASGGSDALTPSDIGAETPAGAQAKAEATAGAVLAELDAHKAKSASTSQKGHVQLSTSTTSTSTSLAATASAVKTVNDALTSHKAAAAPHSGHETPAGAQAKAEAAAGAVLAELNTHKADGTQHAKTARFVIGTSTAGWTAKDCDYLCDGTNDQEEIIAALTALPTTGGEIVILDGTYNITASINIPKDNVSIRGSGNATTLKRMYNSTNTDSGPTARGLITLNEKSGCKIQGLQIDGNKATYTVSYNYGIYLSSSSNNTVTGNTCNNNSYGISLQSSSNNTVTGNTCNNSSYGIYLYSSSSDNTVTGNTCNNNNSYGIFLSSSSNNTVTGNTCNNNSYGIFLSSSSNNTVTGNTCNNNSSYGIYLYSSSSDNTVTGNTCNNNSSDGIRLFSSSSDNTVTGNTCNNNSNGIFLFSSSNNTVTGNTCIRGTGQPSDYTSSQYTIHLSGSSNSYNLISSNNCMGKDVVIGGGTSNTSVNNKYN